MTKEKKPTRGNHFLPITYLKHFLHNDKLVMYKKGEKFFKKGSTPADRIVTISGEGGLRVVAKQNDLYTLKEIEGVEPDFMEQFFVELIEGELNELIQEVEKIPLWGPLSNELKKKICTLMASMTVRVPGTKQETEALYSEFLKMHFQHIPMSEKEKTVIRDKAKQEEGREITDKDFEDAIQAFADGDLKLEISSNLFVKDILMKMGHFANIFYGMKMCIIKSDGKNLFITSDNPVAWFVPRDKMDYHLNAPRSLMSQYTEVNFPLTKNYCIALTRRDDWREVVVPSIPEAFDILENTLSCFSRDYIFSPVQKTVLDDFAKKHIPYPFKLVTK